MIKQIAIVNAVEGGLCCCCAIFAGQGCGGVGLFKMTSKVHDKHDSEGSLPIACVVSL